MALVDRRLVSRFVIMLAVALAVVFVASKLEGEDDAEDIEVVVDVEAVPGLRSVEVELRQGPRVVAHTERNYRGGLAGPVRLRGPALDDGEVRVLLDTEEGPRRIRHHPVTARGGSQVLVHAGVAE